MNVLGIRTHYTGPDGKLRLSAVDWWRVDNPLTEVAKHTDISVDFKNKIAMKPGEEEKAYTNIGSKYDVVWTSYIDNPKGYSWLKATCKQNGMTHVMDIDDNIFDIDPMNPATLRYFEGSEAFRNAQIILKDADVVTTTTEYLAKRLRDLRGDKPVYVLPNYIDTGAYDFRPNLVPDNKTINIGYQGSATHYSDIFSTGFIWGLRKVLKKYPQTRFVIIGSAFDELDKYLPKDQIELVSGAPDHVKWRKIWQTMPIDIGTAPLLPSAFNKGKSEIKYYEYSLRQIPGVYSFFDPYLRVVKENETGFLAQDEDEWFEKLSWLVENEKLRQKIGKAAYNDVRKNYIISKHWKEWEKVLKKHS